MKNLALIPKTKDIHKSRLKFASHVINYLETDNEESRINAVYEMAAIMKYYHLPMGHYQNKTLSKKEILIKLGELLSSEKGMLNFELFI